MTSIATQKFTKTVRHGLDFYTNSHAGSGVFQWISSECPKDKCIVALTRHYHSKGEKRTYSEYAIASREQIQTLIQTNHNLMEVMPASTIQKVAFDIERTSKDDPLEQCKEVILKHFPGAQMNISGSTCQKDDGTKWSYHIILQNYTVQGSELEPYTAPLKAFAIQYDHLGFDKRLYRINGLLKFINQSKYKDNERVQSYIAGSTDPMDHTVTHNVPKDAVDISTLDFSGIPVYKMAMKKSKKDGGEQKLRIDCISDVKPQELEIPAWFDSDEAQPIDWLNVLPNPPRGSEYAYSYDVQWNVMRWCKSVSLSFEDTWEWLKQKDDSLVRQQKYIKHFQECDLTKYPAKKNTVKALVATVYDGNILESKAYPKLKESMNKHYDKQITGDFISSTDYDVDAKHVIVHVPLGGGKTKSVIDWMTEFVAAHPANRILFITCRIALTHEQQAKLNCMNITWGCYLDNTKEECHKADYQYFICSTTSLEKVKTEVDIVVIDECETALGMFTGGSVKCHTDVMTNWRTFLHLMENASRVFWMDGMITKVATDTVKLLGGSSYTIGRKALPKSRVLKEVGDIESMYGAIIEAIKKGQKIFVAAPKKGRKVKGAGSVEHIVSTLCNVFGWNRGTEIIGYHADMTAEKKRLSKVNEVWSDPALRCVVANSALSVGIDFNMEDVFDGVFAIFSHTIMSHRDFIQLLYRVRNPKSSTITFCYFKHKSTSEGRLPKYLVPTDEVYQTLVANLDIEQKACKKDERRRVFKLFCHCMNIKFSKETVVKMDDAEKEYIQELYNTSQVIYRWDNIPMPNSDDLRSLRAVERGRYTTMQQLMWDKYLFSKRFLENTPDEVMGPLWNDHHTFVERCDILQRMRDEWLAKSLSFQLPMALVIRRFLDENKITVGDEIPEEPLCTIPMDEINQAFVFHNQLTSYRHDMYSKILSAYFSTEVLKKDYNKTSSGRRYTWVTSPDYLDLSRSCTDNLISYSNWSLMNGEENIDECERAD